MDSKIVSALAMIPKFYERISSRRKDIFLCFLVLVAALIMRVPFLNYPPEPLYDEEPYVFFVTATVFNIPYFDIHPPLAKMIYAAIAKQDRPPLLAYEYVNDAGQIAYSDWASMAKHFTEFPYISVRLIDALAGSLLAGVLFLLARTLGLSRKKAFIVGLFVVCDGAFILFSRIIQPDMIMLLFGFSGLTFFLQSSRTPHSGVQKFFLLVAALLLGLALSIKWTALGFLVVVLFQSLSQKKWATVIFLPIISLTVYTSVFALFIFHTNPGTLPPAQNIYRIDYIESLTFPGKTTVPQLLSFVARYHHVMQSVNTEESFQRMTPKRSPVYLWPNALGEQTYYTSVHKKIGFAGNFIVWNLAFISILTLVGTILYRWLATMSKKNTSVRHLSQSESFLLSGYIINLLPFFFITLARPMYIYHYFTALIFAFVSIPFGLTRLFNYANVSEKTQNILYKSFTLLAILFALVLFPLAYGIL